MADAKRKAYPKFVTPKGAFKFPKLNEPDFGSKDYPKPDGEYSLKLIMQADDPATKAFIAKLQPAYEEATAEADRAFKDLKVETRKKLGKVTMNGLFTTIYDQETEQPTGEIEFKFAMKASGELKKGPKAGQRWNRAPDIFDAKGLPLKKAPSIWGGTIGKVSFEASPYFIPGTGAGGLKLNLMGVQIIDLVSGGQRTAASHGFGEEEGFTGSSVEDTADEDNTEGFSDESNSSSDDAGKQEDF